MYEPSTWKTDADFERDILLFAEFNVKPEDANQRIRIPETILRYNQQMARNKKSRLNGDLDDGLTYVVSGRGRGVRDRVLRPGENLSSDPFDDLELKKKIRQVSGLGYSNELIERAMECSSPYEQNSSSDDGEFKLVPSGTLSENSSSSSKSSTPVKRPKNISS